MRTAASPSEPRRFAALLRAWVCPAPEPGAVTTDVELDLVAQSTHTARRMQAWRVLLVVAGTAWVVLTLRAALSVRLEDFRETFRASETVALAEAAPARVRGFLWSWIQRDPALCGVAAPNLQEYVQLAVLRLRGAVTEVVNPSYTADPRDPRVETAEETNALCHSNATGVPRTRPRSILISYQTHHARPLWMRDVPLTDGEARCFQHLVDVLNGTWPCAPSSTHPSDVLRIPRVPADWFYYRHP